MENVIRAEVMQQAVITLNLSFGVRILEPIEMPWRVYNVSMQEMLVRTSTWATTPKYAKQVLEHILAEKILADYNQLIEDYPLLDMFADPEKYKPGSRVEITILNPGELPSVFRS